MINEMAAVIWKEWKEVFLQRGSAKSGLFNLILILVLMGIFIPLQSGEGWFTSFEAVFIWAWLPMFMAMSVVTDAFAGERERHTLETLLASRLSDQGILFGKISAAVIYSWATALAGMLLGALTINLVVKNLTHHFYSLPLFLGGILGALLVITLFSILGMLVSLRSPTARQAYQKLSGGIIVLILIPMLIGQFVPQEQLIQTFAFLDELNPYMLAGGLGLGLLVIDIALLFLARSKFQRSRLILD